MRPMHLIVLAVIAFILMLVFGHSPMDDIRKKRELRKAQSLVDHIMEKNGQKERKGKGPSLTGIQMGGDTSEDKSQDTEDAVAAGPHSAFPHAYQGNTGNGDLSNFVAHPQRQNMPASAVKPAPKAVSPAPADEYYPPTPGSVAPRPVSKPQSALTDMLYRGRRVALNDGRYATFDGTHVFTEDNNGKVQPLKDGKYPIYNGSIIMVIRGGEKVQLD